MDILTLVVLLVAQAIGLGILYLVVKAAVLGALREHTTSSTTGVSVVSANVLPVRIVEDAPPAPPTTAAPTAHLDADGL